MVSRTQKQGIAKVAGIGIVAAVIVGAGLHFASAGEVAKAPAGNKVAAAGAQTVNCPTVRGRFANIPAQASAEVE
ncbi:hypothetical protein ACFQ0D_13220, partial [Micromonospora zhanjiangensis]